MKDSPASEIKGRRPKAVLASVQLPGVSDEDHESSLAELQRLVHTLGFEVIGTISQNRASLATDAVFGTGKLRELASYTGGSGVVTKDVPMKMSKARKAFESQDEEELEAIEELHEEDVEEFPTRPEDQRAEFVIFDNELSPTQLKNLESCTDVEVMDRTGVIVEIFHRHAKTREARLQVEIARLRYLSPRLRVSRKGGDRSGGGIGAKGAGETAHELDKRRIRDRIAELGRELESIQVSQKERRARREEQLRVALVGYTNAGKSSLMRALTGSEVLVQDKLFATLDTTVRAMQPETVPRILVSDTVGFIKKLPHDLVASFRSTLDEAHGASLLLYVADSSDPTFRSQLAVTREVIGEIGAEEIESRLVLNKVDRLSELQVKQLRVEFPDAIMLSAKNKDDVNGLKALILKVFDKGMEEIELRIPYAKSSVIGEVRRLSRVISEGSDEHGMTLRVKAPRESVAKLQSLLK